MVFRNAPPNYFFSLVVVALGGAFFSSENNNHRHAALAKNMNHGGGPYRIANSDAFDTEYRDDREYFDVYSNPIKTLYSEVHWTAHRNIKLPEDIVERFENGKLAAITGYEVDQVRTTTNGEDIPVPITWAYNHHYCAHLVNSRKFRLVEKEIATTTAGDDDDYARLVGQLAHGASHHLVGEFREGMGPEEEDGGDEEIPQMHFFSEGNGGEMRMSYHGYPRGYAQIIESPNEFLVTPMQIDTWNRDMANGTYLPGPLPSGSRIPQNAGYNGLLECPCSDRLPFEWGMTYAIIDKDDDNTDDKNKCKEGIENATECFAAVKQVIEAEKYDTREISDDASLPPGCTSTLDEEGTVRAVWNNKVTDAGPETPRAAPAKDPRLVGVSLGLVNLTVAIDPAASSVQLKLTGPADRWFGIGFGTGTMCLHTEGDECPGGGPYAIIVSGGTVEERKLDYHGPGFVLSNSITVRSDRVDRDNGIRTVHLSRPLRGATDNHYSFDLSSLSIPLITANGCSPEFGQHCGHGPNRINLVPVNTPKKLCRAGIKGTIDGANFNNDRCAPFPTSDLLEQNNPTCHIQTYKGGLRCCRHGKSLLDEAQEIPWKDQPLEYRLKFRFYFEEYHEKPSMKNNAAGLSLPSPPPSHRQLIRLYWQTEAHAGEYDITQCTEGTPPSECVQIVTSRWSVRDMLADCPIHDASYCTGRGSRDPTKTAGVKLIYAGPHCHAPTCLSMDLYDADTGQLLCHAEPIHGSGEMGKMYDEHGFLSIPPCLWGEPGEGLPEPRLLSLDTTLMSVKRNNNTLPHTGEMASWQMRGILVRKGEEDKNRQNLLVSPATTNRRLRRPVAEESK